MGETRTKKSSKRALKPTRPTDTVSDIKDAFHHPDNKIVGDDANGKASTPQSGSRLAPPALSSRASRSSLQSSSSSSSKAARCELDTYDPSRIEIVHTVNKGKALFAASYIPKGAIVLAEVPAIRLTAEDEVKKLEADEILLEKFNQLPERSQKKFKKLHDAKKDGFTKLRSIYHSNCYNLEGSRSTFGGSCIGLIASRINHSCIPNVQFTYLETIPEQLFANAEDDEDESSNNDEEKPNFPGGVMVFRALKAISKGKEILANYESIYATRSQRQSQFQMHYGFRCDCDACIAPTDFWERDDDRRQEMIRYRNRVDAIERRVVLKQETTLNSSEVDVYYLKSKKSKDEPSINAGDLSPLSISCCDEVIDTLELLERLLVKEGLMGIDLQRVREEMTLWKKRADSCGQGTRSSC